MAGEVYSLSDLLSDTQSAVTQAGGIATSGQEIYNKLTGQDQPAPGPLLPGAGEYTASPTGQAGTTIPPWIWMGGLMLAALIGLAFVFGGRSRGK